MTAASTAELQEQQDALMEQLPVLPLDTSPRYSTLEGGDLLALAAVAGGKGERQVAAELLAGAAASERVTACELCGRRGLAVAPASGRESAAAAEDPCALLFTASTSLVFAARRVRVLGGAFLCGRCRAVRNPATFTRLFVPLVRGAPGDGREAELQELLLHLAAVNNAPPELTSNPTALAAWGLQLASRAAALRIVAGGVHGWALEKPGGRALAAAPPLPGTGVELVRALLEARSSDGGGSGTNKSGRDSGPGSIRAREHKQKARHAKGGRAPPEESQCPKPDAVAPAAVVSATPSGAATGGGGSGGGGGGGQKRRPEAADEAVLAAAKAKRRAGVLASPKAAAAKTPTKVVAGGIAKAPAAAAGPRGLVGAPKAKAPAAMRTLLTPQLVQRTKR